MTTHDHREYVKGCFRCDLSRIETARGMSREEADAYEETGFLKLLSAIEDPAVYWEERCARAENRLAAVRAALTGPVTASYTASDHTWAVTARDVLTVICAALDEDDV